jgi:hypothetical protein
MKITRERKQQWKRWVVQVLLAWLLLIVLVALITTRGKH